MNNNYLTSSKLRCLLLSPLFMMSAQLASAQSQVITGVIKDAQGQPVIGASVRVQGQKQGAITDFDGKFSLNADAKSNLIVSYIGYESQTVPVNGQTTLNVTMKDNSTNLQDVVVVGYGTQKKASLTSAITQIKGDEVFSNRQVSNPASALQGSIPGMVVTRTSTRPGNDGTSFKIRGDISVNGNSSPMILIDGMYGSITDLNGMDANDIASVTVLKDASAAIYGARSANGVVLVTTKRGKKGKAQITYNGTFSTSIDGIQPKLTTNAQWLDMFYDAQLQDAQVVHPNLKGKLNAQGYPAVEDLGGMEFWWILSSGAVMSGTDASGKVWAGRELWQALKDGKALNLNNAGKSIRYEPWHYLMDELYGSTFSQKHDLSITGGDDKFKYRLSLGYAQDKSQLKVAEDQQKKYSGMLNVDYQANDWLKIESGLAYEKRLVSSPSTDIGTGFYDPWLWPMYNEKGEFYDTFGGRNPIGGLVGGGRSNSSIVNFRANLKATVDLAFLTKGLTFSLSGVYKNVSQQYTNTKLRIDYYDWTGDVLTKTRQAKATISEESKNYEYTNGGLFFNYNRTFNNVHAVSAMLGMSAEQEPYKRVYAARNNGELYPGSGLIDLNVFQGGNNNGADGGQTNWAFVSYLTRLGYTYNNRYILEFLGRRDGSSRLTEDQRWKNFYSFSAGWVMTEENFMKNLHWDWLNFFKIRYNYGKTGSVEGIGDYERYATINQGNAWFDDGTGALAQLPTASLGMVASGRTWETIKSHDVGFDFSLFNSRLSGTFDWYQRTNDGMFISVTYPSILGIGAPKTNNGKFRSKGWEVELNWRDRIGEVTYNIGANLADNHTEVMRLENNENVPNAGVNTGRLIGKPKTALYVYETMPIFQNQAEVDAYYNKYYWVDPNDHDKGVKPGNILPAPQDKNTGSLRPGARGRVDVNGNGVIDKDDLVYKGDTAPHFTFGFRLGLEWKGIDFNAFFQGQGKQNVLRTGYLYAPWIANYTLQNAAFMGKTWTDENPNAEYPIISRNSGFNNWNYSNVDASVQNSRYVRLKSLVVGYTLPQTWTKKFSVSKLRLFFSAEDLFEITSIKDGYDPEAGEASNNMFPFNRTLSFGLNVTF